MPETFLKQLQAGTALPATGTAHGHVRLINGLLARVAHAYEGDATATIRLHTQAEAFRYLAPAGCTPRLYRVMTPHEKLPGGALIIDYIDGRPPRLPDDLPAIASTLARIHALKLPPAGSPLPRQVDPFIETLQGIEANALRFLDRVVEDGAVRAEIDEELRQLRALAGTLDRTAQPLAVALADTHPGNFIVDRTGDAWFVDLEKVHVGSPAIDLAHATLPTSTLWHPDVDSDLARDDVRGFYEAYLARLDAAAAAALRPWLLPMRRLTWLRTTLFMARWRVETRGARDPANTTQWSDSGLAPHMKRHIDRTIDRCFSLDFVRRVRAEWET